MNQKSQNIKALVSIGLPVYNEEIFLAQTLNSILEQDYQNFELIIADNASTDNTSVICQEYAKKDSRIRYCPNSTNIGAAGNFEKVVELARGDYFVWVSGHDLWHSQFLSLCVENMSQDDSMVLCHPQAMWINAESQPLGMIPGSVDTRGLDTISRVNVVLWGLGYCYPVYGLIKLSTLKQATLGLKIIGPDVLLLAELSLFGTFSHIQQPLLYIRRMADFGDWNRYIEKVFNQRLSELSATQLFWEIIESHVQVILKHIESSPEKNSITISIVNCLLTKYQWILNTMVSSNSSGTIREDDYHQRILNLFDQSQKFSNCLNNLILLTPQQSISEITAHENSVHNPIIIIDGVFFQLYSTGIARVWRTLLEEWANTEFAAHIIVLDRANSAPKIPGIRYLTIPAYSYNNTDADKQMLQQVCDQEGADLFISTYYTTPLSTPSVFMAYDMIPEVLGGSLNQPMWREKHHAIRQACSYAAISENTARDLVKFFPDISIEQITVAHCGVAPIFTPATATEISTFKHKYGISKPYFLLVGAGSNYKNAILFFRAFDQLHTKQGFEIICTGSGVTLANEYRQYTSGTVVHSLTLSDEELKIAYSGAVALVYPSLYEGFGMPVLEALACGCPVITCANASIPEVAGEAAIYVDANDVDSLTDALCEVQKSPVRSSLITAGLTQAKQFSWVKMAEIMSSALIQVTLARLNLQRVNFIIFPDWSQSEETVGLELQEVIKTLVNHPDKAEMTLLIDNSNITPEEADLVLSSVAMNLLMEEEIEFDGGPEIVLVGELSPMQWSALISKLQGRIKLDHENQEVIDKLKVDTIPVVEPDNN
ncbi:glycosyltransferase [Arthrospira platensis NCB002]|jgi:glycosyltransferase involved in cell wall biosynthesis|uniref:Glycosyl transferase n=1 Tax=Limnospira platensis NIES-46 TaxID=1236695 RepID=A0A5M3T867_LIMPL|nr:glycosyltransferase [Arthrospira platensis]MDF2209991.1 glycosyltransferase [Arthrospira platensis NCB002]BAI89175.1 probable glycosyl transferase [Arthrospira platensis NIES-39]BDT11567.1 probable glycosyl transferase [Arthrospira platensis NIES-39]GCE93609.1 putative glycosyl transferase [Arthrospira platensis NIES-46]